MRTPTLNAEEIEWAYEKWCLGYSLAAIAKPLFVSRTTLSRALEGRSKVRPPLVYDGPRSDKYVAPNIRVKER